MKSKLKNFDINQDCQSLGIQNGKKVLPPPNYSHSQCSPTADVHCRSKIYKLGIFYPVN